VPCVYAKPWTRTEYALMSLMADERALPDRVWVEHAYAVMHYLEERLVEHYRANPQECRRRSREGSRPE
jgi:hypothetical protein